MPYIHADFPDALLVDATLRTQDIPCRFHARFADMELVFEPPLFSHTATLVDGDFREIMRRAAPLVGGEVTHDRHALVSLQSSSDGRLMILGLKLFYEGEGWISVIEKGAYAPIDESETD